MEEALAFYSNVDDPYNYVKYTPTLFNKWSQWAKTFKHHSDDTMRPFGEKLGPDWMKGEFDCLETFYQFYINLIQGD